LKVGKMEAGTLRKAEERKSGRAEKECKEQPMISANLDAVKRLFSEFSGNFIYEIELANPAPFIDVSTCLLKKEMTRLLQYWQEEGISEELKKNEIWHTVYQFCLEWTRVDSPAAKTVDNIWFEFDHPQLNKTLPEPCLFLAPLLSAHQQNMFDVAVNLLKPGRISKKATAVIKNSISKIPSDGNIFQLGTLLARNLDELRICTSMPQEKYIPYLEQIRWPGSYRYLEPLLMTFSEYADKTFLDFDVGETVAPKIGLEFCYTNHSNFMPGLSAFFDLLIELQLCNERNRDHILNWLNVRENNQLPWVKRDLKKGISHIKIVLNEDNTAEAKIYLTLSDWEQSNYLISHKST